MRNDHYSFAIELRNIRLMAEYLILVDSAPTYCSGLKLSKPSDVLKLTVRL